MKDNNLQQKNNTNVSVQINMNKNNLQSVLQTLCHCIFLRKENTENSKCNKVSRTRGSILTISVLIFAITSTILGLTIAFTVVKNAQNTRGGLYSKQAFQTAEALQEDVLYRMKKNMIVSPSETLVLAGATSTVAITDLPYGKKIVVTASSSDYIRNLQTIVSQATGTSFAYAVQSGSGGFEMGQNSTVYGNVYSNGNIKGGQGSTITGGAISASTTGNSLIQNVVVGVDAWANSIDSSKVTGNLYCQTGTGNTGSTNNSKNCDTSKSNPDTQPFPISDEMIAVWKAKASAGGSLSGMSVSGTDNRLGLKKINGDLTLNTSAILYLDGIVWVTGNLTLEGLSNLKLSSSYVGSGMIIVDGKTSIANNSTIYGSGQIGSYIMILSTSPCDGVICSGVHAIDVSNNAGAVILNAQKGSVKFANRSGAKAVTANKIILDNNAGIDYVVGLINTTFTTGPMGSWDIDSWQETI